MVKIKLSDIFFIVELILNVIVIGVLINQFIFSNSPKKLDLHFVKNQFCYGATFGPVFLLLFFVMIFIAGQARPVKTGILVAALGAVLFFIAGGLILKEASDNSGYLELTDKDKYHQLTAGGALAVILGAVFLVHVILAAIYLKKGRDEPDMS